MEPKAERLARFTAIMDIVTSDRFSVMPFDERHALIEEIGQLRRALWSDGILEPDRSYYRYKAQRAGEVRYVCGGVVYRTEDDYSDLPLFSKRTIGG